MLNIEQEDTEIDQLDCTLVPSRKLKKHYKELYNNYIELENTIETDEETS